jgi:hypothetical protein
MALVLNGDGAIAGLSAGGLPNNSVISDNIASLAATKLSGQVPDVNAPSGSVLQVRELMLTSYVSNGNFSSETNSGYQDVSGYNLSITPLSSSSKIIVMVNTWISSQRIWMRVVRNSTVIGVGDAVGGVNQQAGMYNHQVGGMPVAYTWMDSPNTTSSVNYKVQIGGETNITAAFIGAAQSGSSQNTGPANQWPSLVRTMLLWEIAA